MQVPGTLGRLAFCLAALLAPGGRLPAQEVPEPAPALLGTGKQSEPDQLNLVRFELRRMILFQCAPSPSGVLLGPLVSSTLAAVPVVSVDAYRRDLRSSDPRTRHVAVLK